jgi:MYXO-CTERM domain-containing protein
VSDRLRPILFAVAALALLAALVAPWAARADGDPASDTLLIQPLYTPVSQKISPDVLKTLDTTIASANTAGFKVRVALILDRTDLGAVPQLFGHPLQYVHLLAGELYFGWKGGIIAVQPSGIGVRNMKPLAPAQAVVNGIAIAKPATADSLAIAATTAIRKLAAKRGITLAAGPTTAPSKSGSSSSTTTIVIVAVVVVVLLALLAGLLVLRRRRSASS